MRAKLFEDIVKEKFHHSGSVNGFVARYENRPFTKSMVDYDH